MGDSEINGKAKSCQRTLTHQRIHNGKVYCGLSQDKVCGEQSSEKIKVPDNPKQGETTEYFLCQKRPKYGESESGRKFCNKIWGRGE